LIPQVIPPNTYLGKYEAKNGYQTLYETDGGAVALVYSTPYEVQITWILKDEEALYQYGVGRRHEITLKEVE
jgi:hypothetical protein